MSQKIDRFGAIASSVCAVHCATVALLPLAFGALGLSFLAGHEAEWMFTLVAVAFAAVALNVNWRKNHSTQVTTLLILGIVGLLASRAIEMSSGDHGHHEHKSHVEQVDHAGSEHEAHKKDKHDEKHGEHEDEHHDAHGAHNEHEGIGHALGTAVGVIAGLLLFVGHLVNLRITRRREECCD